MSWHSNELRVIANILEDHEGVNDNSDNLRMAAAGMDRLEAQVERLTAENAALKAEVERLTLRWSSERPTAAGYYLWRQRFRDGRWTKGMGMRLEDDDQTIHVNENHQYAGPIVVQESTDNENKEIQSC